MAGLPCLARGLEHSCSPDHPGTSVFLRLCIFPYLSLPVSSSYRGEQAQGGLSSSRGNPCLLKISTGLPKYDLEINIRTYNNKSLNLYGKRLSNLFFSFQKRCRNQFILLHSCQEMTQHEHTKCLPCQPLPTAALAGLSVPSESPHQQRRLPGPAQDSPGHSHVSPGLCAKGTSSGRPPSHPV